MGRRVPSIAALAALAVALVALAAPAAAGAQAVAPYGTNDAGGFRNVLPPGSPARQRAPARGHPRDRQRSPHFTDQQPLYDGLLVRLADADATTTIATLLQGRHLRRARRRRRVDRVAAARA